MQIRDAVSRYVKNVVINVPDEHNIPIVQIERKISVINDLIEKDITSRLFNDFGVTVTGVDIAAIEIDKASDGYRQLKAITKDITTAKVEAQTEVEIKEMKADQKLGVFSKAANIYSDIKDRNFARKTGTSQVNNVAGKIGEVAAKGVGVVSSIGSSFVQNLGNTNENQQGKANNVEMPPIPNISSYYVARNGEADGPFDVKTLKEMASKGELMKTSLVWKQGMDNWEEAQSIGDLSEIFKPMIPDMPPIPSDK